MTETYYTLLEVPRSASPEEIRDAFIKLMRQVHPDLLANVPEYWKRQAEERSKDITEAYRVLSDPKTRGSYDQQLDAYQHAQSSQPGANSNNHTTQTKNPQAVPSTPAASTRWPAHSWLDALSSPSKGFVAALICILVIMGIAWPMADQILGRRTSAPASSAAPAIQSQPVVSGPSGHMPLPARPTPSKKFLDPSSAPAQEESGEADRAEQEGSATRTAHDAVPDTSTTSQIGTQIGRGGQVMQWNARTKSWQKAKSSGTGGAVRGVQWYVQWDTKTSSWRITDPNSKNTPSRATR
jgi:hypothetical protein